MSAGEIAGLLAAIAAVVLVALLAVPLLKLGRVLEELRLVVRDVGHSSVPILHELKGTVTATNAGATFAVTLVRLRGGVWRAVLTPEQLATWMREAIEPETT